MSSDGLPKAPPAEAVAPSRRSPLLWVLLALGVLITVAVGVTVWGLIAFAGHDRIELIDDPAVVARLEPVCDELAQVVGANPGDGDEELRAVSSTARKITTRVDELPRDLVDGDLPTEDWARDWTTLLDRLDAYVASDRAEPFALPRTDDGFSVVERMDLASPATGCEVPRSLVRLDREPPPRAPENE